MKKLIIFSLTVFILSCATTPSSDQPASFERHMERAMEAALKGDMEQAGIEGEEALRQAEKFFGAESEQAAMALLYLIPLRLLQGRYTDAEMAGKRSLVIYEKVYGPRHVETAAVIAVLG